MPVQTSSLDARQGTAGQAETAAGTRKAPSRYEALGAYASPQHTKREPWAGFRLQLSHPWLFQPAGSTA